MSLKPSSEWDPVGSAPLSENYIDFDIPSFFGVIAADISNAEALSYDLSRSQFFPTEEWVPLAQAMQAAQAAGTGIISTTALRTVANDFYGIPAGLDVEVTWVYLGRSALWESKLPPEMQVRGSKADTILSVVG